MEEDHSRLNKDNAATTNRRLGRLLLIYMLIRVVGANAFAWLVPQSSWDAWFWLIELALFGLIAFMIWSEAGRLADFQIDKASLWIYLIFGPVFHIARRRDAAASVALEYALFFLIAIWLIISLRRKRGFPQRGLPNQWGWIAVALSALLSWVFFYRLEIAIEASASITEELPSGYSIAFMIVAFARNMGNAAVLEEPVFRGFLMGFWRKAGLNPIIILIGQTALFMLAHLHSIENPAFFWIGLPIGGLVFGWLAWKSRSVAASMLVHASANALVSIF